MMLNYYYYKAYMYNVMHKQSAVDDWHKCIVTGIRIQLTQEWNFSNVSGKCSVRYGIIYRMTAQDGLVTLLKTNSAAVLQCSWLTNAQLTCKQNKHGYSQAGNTFTSNIKPVSTSTSMRTVKYIMNGTSMLYAILCDSLSTAMSIPEALGHVTHLFSNTLTP